MATTLAPPTASPETARVSNEKTTHKFHGSAHLLHGQLHRPIQQVIERQGQIDLNDYRGGHLTRSMDDNSIEGLISYTRGETRVSGSRSLKNNGWMTLSTSILEGFNAFEILTADRIVSQVATEHPYENGHFPIVQFLGTQFRNLEVSGFPVILKLNFGICGDKPANDQSYFDDADFLRRVKAQNDAIANDTRLPKHMRETYYGKAAVVDDLLENVGRCEEGKTRPKFTCSLVESIEPIPIPGVETVGNMLVIPEFGTVALAEIEVGEEWPPKPTDGEKWRPDVYFTLRALHMNLGCVGHGSVQTATATANGTTRP